AGRTRRFTSVDRISSRWSKRALCVLIAASIAMAMGSTAPSVVRADTGPYGQVIVPGSAWAPQYAPYGDVNVYGNGAGFNTGSYQCTELAARWTHVAFGEP